MVEHETTDLRSYKVIERRLYGELMKTCRRYSNELSLISLLGILDIVKQEMKDLDKTNRTFLEAHDEASSRESLTAEKTGLDSLP